MLRDLETSALDEKHKALFRFVDKVNHDSPRITADDMQPLREAGGTTKPFISPSQSARCLTSTIAGSMPAACMRSPMKRTGRAVSDPPRAGM